MKHLLLAFAVALFVSSCSDPSEPEPMPVSYKIPGTGSTFVYSTHDIDDNGTKIPGSEKERMETVVATNAVVDNIAGVWIVQGADSTYYRIDQYNDVQMRSGGMNDAFFDSAWIRLPYTSGAPSTVYNIDRYTTGGVLREEIKVIYAERMTEQSFVINGSNVRAYEFKVSYSTTTKSDEVVESDLRATTYVWFAPSLGTVIRRATPAQDWFGTKRDGHVEELGSYTLK